MSGDRMPLISGNWKMNHNHFEAIQTVQKLAYALDKDDFEACDVSVHPPFTDLRSVQTVIQADDLKIQLGAQNVHPAEKGAFTGEVSAHMLAKLDVSYVIVGHSERRELFGESDEVVGILCSLLEAALCLRESDNAELSLVPISCRSSTELSLAEVFDLALVGLAATQPSVDLAAEIAPFALFARKPSEWWLGAYRPPHLCLFQVNTPAEYLELLEGLVAERR